MAKLQDKLLYGERARRITASLLFSFCLIILIWAIIFKFNISSLLSIERNRDLPLWERFTAGLIPLRSLIDSLNPVNWFQIGIFFLNIFCFIPAGMLLPFITGRKKCLLFFFLFPCALELFQLFSGFGVLDTTDLITNFTGGYIGCKIYDLLYPRLSERAINTMLLSLLLPAFCLSAFVIIRTIVYFPI